MMKLKLVLFVVFLTCLLLGEVPAQDKTVPEWKPNVVKNVGPRLQKLSVNVYCSNSYGGGVQGSGTIFLSEVFSDREREAMSHQAAFILTAHHVVEDLREVKTVIINGETKTVVRYRDAQIVQERVENGRTIGEVKYDAKVINVDPRRDIALLRVRKGDFATIGADFYNGISIPCAGIEIYHCGAPGGKETGGTCSLTSGIVSRIGVRIPDFGGGSEFGIFDQTDTAALGGSSGGMVALKSNGQWIGMITLGLRSADSFHWFVPARSVSLWAEEIEIMWLFDSSVDRPTEDEITAIVLELHIKPGTFKSPISKSAP